ncbi:hypothetical protein Tco_1568842 [Tanacetum coccineum]
MENYKKCSQDIRESTEIPKVKPLDSFTGIDNDIYSTVDACSNACEMWKAIESCHVTNHQVNIQFYFNLQTRMQRFGCDIVKQSHELKIVLFINFMTSEATPNEVMRTQDDQDDTDDLDQERDLLASLI